MERSLKQNGVSVHPETSAFGSFLDTSGEVAYNGQIFNYFKKKRPHPVVERFEMLNLLPISNVGSIETIANKGLLSVRAVASDVSSISGSGKSLDMTEIDPVNMSTSEEEVL